MTCPGPEQAAAYADGRLDAADAARFLEHCSECDECRRTLAVLSLPHEAGGVPAEVEARAIAAVRRSVGDRDRSATRPIRRVPSPRRPQSSPAGFLIAAALLAGFVGLVLMAKQPSVRVPEAKELSLDGPPLIAVDPPRPVTVPSARELPPPEPEPKRELVGAPKPLAPKIEEPKAVEPSVESVVREVPRIDEPKPEAPAKATPGQTVVQRALTELQITDISGPLTILRKGAKTREKLTGVARLAEGDVVTAEKSASFRVDGRHPMVLSEDTSLSMAYLAEDSAPWIRLHSGEALVDSTGSARWVVTDGQFTVAVKPARARFTAARGDACLSLASLSEPLFVQPDGGQVHAIQPGHELHVGRSAPEVKPLAPGVAGKKIAAFEAARPRQRTIFYTSCDPVDAKREHFFVREGGWLRNDGLLSREQSDRSSYASISPNPRFAWRNNVVLRFRIQTNCRSVETQMRVDDRKYTLWKVVALERKSRDPWMTVEIPFEIPPAPKTNWSFRRDDGGNQLQITLEDMFDWIRFIARPSEVIGDVKPYLLVDDIQVVEKE
jgi:hypothetical protein